MAEESTTVALSTSFVFRGPGDDDDDDDDDGRDALTRRNRTRSRRGDGADWFSTLRWLQRVSKYLTQQSQSQSNCARPDPLEYDFVMPTETAASKCCVPLHNYDERTVRLAPDGSWYLRNRYKQKV
jgi:hypothetical protein